MSKKKSKSSYNYDIKGLIYITLGILSLLSVFSSSSSGIVGHFTKKILFSILGLGAYIFPFFIIFLGFCLIIKKGLISISKKFYGILLLLETILLTLQMININLYYNYEDIISGVIKIYNSNSVIHGGIISYLITISLYKLFGIIGSFIILIFLYILSFILIWQISLYDVIVYLNSNFKFKKIEKNKVFSKEKNEVEADVLIASDAAKEDFIKKVNNKIKIIDFIKSSNINNEQAVEQTIQEDKIDQLINIELEEQINKNSTDTGMEYIAPSSELLNLNSSLKLNKEDKRELINNASKLEETLISFGVEAKVVQVTKGPSVTRFEIQPQAGVKVSKIVNLADDIALSLAASGVRIEAPIPGKSAVGIEVPNKELTAVFLREVIESQEFIDNNKNLAFCLGKDISGNCVVSDLSKMPHVLIAGATGSGKSVCINTLIVSLLYKYSPEDVKLLMIDPKVVELSVYNGIPHLLIPVVTEPKKAAGALNWAVNEMTKRYKIFAENNVRNIESYNELVQKGKLEDKLPWIVIIVDELADLMMVCPNDIEDYIGRLAQMARAAGMHLVIATQRPSVDVITGVIKANIPSRISFAVSSQIDSRTILDTAGAEKLLGKGDMLFYPVGESKPIRIQGAFISEEEVERVVSFIKNQKTQIEYKNEILEELDHNSTETNSEELDSLINEAVKIVVDAGQASTSLIQRKLRIGYNRAARIIEQMEELGIISSKDGSKPRQILLDKETALNVNYLQANK
ncbi:DNA translocase FtsK [Clostridium sp. SYSU_GA19001]|uniref:FtsK/SpoIIIE family DNA translocase n=1 Tax=Clostridium caldaquaticum TaxID=2940653 RepID=UPI0020773EB9|nr:DNA translocase FtsK [Clostridium caldaquaticum]MCM8710639.1 DNA translocase FtsK [Clostridium caldaquaticum]